MSNYYYTTKLAVKMFKCDNYAYIMYSTWKVKCLWTCFFMPILAWCQKNDKILIFCLLIFWPVSSCHRTYDIEFRCIMHILRGHTKAAIYVQNARLTLHVCRRYRNNKIKMVNNSILFLQTRFKNVFFHVVLRL